VRLGPMCDLDLEFRGNPGTGGRGSRSALAIARPASAHWVTTPRTAMDSSWCWECDS